MKFINKVMVFVMGLVVIGVVSTTIGVVTQAKTVEKSVTFELLENDELSFNVYDKINEYAVLDDDVVINLVNFTVDRDVEITTPYLVYDSNINGYTLTDDTDSNPLLDITSGGYDIDIGVNVGDIITITFNVEVETPVIIKTLLMLVPLILSAGLIGYIVVKKGDE